MAAGLDDIDRDILAILRENARTSIIDIARSVGLSPAPVARRIDRLERNGVILGYTSVVDDRKTGAMDAFSEIRLIGPLQTSDVAEMVEGIPEIDAFYTISGDADLLVRIRAQSVDDLQRVVNLVRGTGKVLDTKTLIVMKSWTRSPH